MNRYVVKVTNTPGQTRITIPKEIAISTGLDKAEIVEVTITGDKSIKIEVYSGKESEKRDLQKSTD